MVAAYRPRPEVPGAAAQLAFIEVKYGVSAIDGAAGLQKHVTDLHGLLGGATSNTVRKRWSGLSSRSALWV